MSQAAREDPPVTISAFDAFLDGQADDGLWELVAGRIVAMTDPTERHEQIVANIGAPLKLAMDARGLDKPRPDLLVRCGPASLRSFVTDPLVVVEVLSPSTIDTDRGEKLRFYKRLPTLRHIVLVYQDQMRAEHYRRGDVGWDLETLVKPEDCLVFEAVRFEMPLETAYFGVVTG